MPTQEEIAEIIIAKVIEIHEEFGSEVANVFLAGVRFAAELQSEILLIETNKLSSESLGKYYSNISKGEIN